MEQRKDCSDAKTSSVLTKHEADTSALINQFSLVAKSELDRRVKKALDDKQVIGKGGYSKAVALHDTPLVCLVPLEGSSTPKENNDLEIKKNALLQGSVSSPFLQNHLMVDQEGHKVSIKGELGNLSDYIENLKRHGKKFTISETYQILFQIFLGLEAIHEAGLTLLDLKPQNIVIFSEKPLYLRLIDIDYLKLTKKGIDHGAGFTGNYLPLAVFAINDKEQFIYDWAIHRFPQVMDIYAFKKIAGEILAETAGAHPESMKALAQMGYEYSIPYCFSDKTALKARKNIRKLFGGTDQQYIKIKNALIEDAQKFFGNLVQGPLRKGDESGLTDPLQSAPPEIREFLLHYETLRNQESHFLGYDPRLKKDNQTDNFWLVLNSVVKLADELRVFSHAIQAANPSYAPLIKLAVRDLLKFGSSRFSINVKEIMAECDELLFKNPDRRTIAELYENRKNFKAGTSQFHKVNKDLEDLKKQLLTKVENLLSRVKALAASEVTEDYLFERQCIYGLQSLVAMLEIYIKPLRVAVAVIPILASIADGLARHLATGNKEAKQNPSLRQQRLKLSEGLKKLRGAEAQAALVSALSAIGSEAVHSMPASASPAPYATLEGSSEEETQLDVEMPKEAESSVEPCVTLAATAVKRGMFGTATGSVTPPSTPSAPLKQPEVRDEYGYIVI